MDKKFVLFGILASILIGGSFGIFTIEDSFAQNLYVSRDDSEAYKKQQEKAEEEKRKAEERKLKAEEKQEERKLKAEERKLRDEEKLKKLEERKVKLELDRKRLEEKLLEKANKYEEKLRELKEKYEQKIELKFSDDIEKFSAATAKLKDKLAEKSIKFEDKLAKKSEKIREKLLERSEKLDSRTQKILDKINKGDYLGKKIGSSVVSETYQLVFDSVDAISISDKTKTSSLSGFMSFTTFDKGKSNLKLELQECQITVDDIPYNCGFGKARTISSGNSGVTDSLVIIAFLEDDVLGEVHSTLKIFLNADTSISDIEGSSKVTILGPQSKISHMWFLDGTGTLTKTISVLDDSTGNEISVDLDESIDITGN